MKQYRVLFWINIDAIDRGDAEEKAKKLLKKKKLKATLYAVNEA